MPGTKNKAQILYEAVSKDYDLGTYEEFEAKLQNPEKRQAFYNGVGKDYNLGTYEEFETKLSDVLKKKESSEPTPQDPNLDSEAKDTDGLSATQEPNTIQLSEEELGVKPKDKRGQLVKDIDAGKFDERIEQSKENQRVLDAQNQTNLNTSLLKYKQSIQPTQEDVSEIEQELINENQGESILSKAYRFASQAWTGQKPLSAREESKLKIKKDLANKSNISIKDVDDNLVEETYLSNKREELLNKKKEAKAEEFIEDNPEIKEQLTKHYAIETAKLENKTVKDLAELNSISAELDDLLSQLNEIDKNHDEAKQYSEDYYQKNIALQQEYENKFVEFNNIQNRFNSNKESLLSVEDELKVFKRNYNKLENFTEKLGIAGEDIVLNLGYLLNKGSKGLDELYKAIGVTKDGPTGADAMETKIIAQKNKLQKEKDLLRNSKSLDDINTPEDLAEWALDLVAEQTPNTILMASTGGASLGVMGASSSGNKLFDLESQERQGLKKYSLLQKYGAAFLTGTAEALSEKVSLGQISKAKRVFNSIGKDKLKESTTAYFKREFPEYLKDIFQEGGSEALSQFSENIVDRYMLGEDKNLTEGISDAFVSGAFMSGLVYKAPSIAKGLSEPFRSKDFNQKINENFANILALDEQLKNDLNPKSKQVIEEKRDNLLKETNQLVDTEFKAIDNLDIETKNTLLDIEQSKYDLRQKAKSIQEEPNLSEKSKESILQDIGKDIKDLNTQKEEVLKTKPTEENNAKTEETTTETKKPDVEVATPKTEVKSEEGIEDTPSPTVELNPENTNETKTQGDTDVNANVQPGVKPNIQQGKDKAVQSAIEPKPSKGTVEVKELSETQEKQNKLVDAKNQYNKLSKTKKNSDVGRELKNSVNELAKDLGFSVSEKRAKLSVKNTKGKEAGKISFKEQLPDSKQEDIDHAIKEVNKGVLLWNGDPLSPRVDLGISRADVRKGEADLKAGKTNTVPAKRLTQALKQAKENGTYEYIEGSGGQINRINVPLTERLDSETELTVQELEEINSNEDALSIEYDNWFNSLDENTQNEILDDYEGQQQQPGETIQNSEKGKSKTNVSNQKEAKPTKQQRKEIVFDKIDNIAQKLKDALPGIKDDDININGFSQDQLIDLMAKSVKHLVGTGIEIDAAIRQVVKSIKDKLGVDIDPETVKSKVDSETTQEPKKTFKRKPGQKSILTRVATGGANTKIKDALKKHGLEYEVENQDEAKARAEAFVKDIGLDSAIDALKNGDIKAGAELAFIYGTVIDMMESQSDKATGKQKEKLENEYAQLQEDIFVAFDAQAREFGRFLSALNKVYNSSYFKYNLSKQIEDHKARNNGEIDAETLKRFEERDAKLKEFEKKIKELETKLEKAEAQQAVDDIAESVERENKNTTKKKLSKSQLKSAANALRKVKFTKSISDLANLQSSPLGVVQGIWDGAVETVAKALEAGSTLEQAIKKGINQIKSTDWYKNLSKEAKKQVEDRFTSDIDSNVSDENLQVVIDEENNIKIPAKLIRQLVADGITDIDQLSQTILDEYLADEDVTLREVRDAITGYGKTINPTKDELSEQISKMKNLGRVLSGMEDVSEGQRPKRSGYQRRKKTDEERKKERALKEAMRDLPIDETTSENEWKTQLDAVKSRLNNQIRDLQDQIDNQERRKPDRTPIEYDQEAKDLATRRDELKQQLDDLVGAPELSYEDKVKAVEKALERSIENLEADITLNRLAFKEKSNITSDKIKSLRERQKELREQLNEMRKESGLIEQRRLDARKKAVANRLAELQEKRRNKDYSKKERKPLPEDQELKELQRKYNKEKEKYDQEAYEEELRNMHPAKKAWKQFVNFLGLQRVLLATGEFSFIFLQNAVPTVNMMLKNPVKLGKILGKTAKAYSQSNFESDYAQMENHELFELAKKSRLALTRTDYKMNAKEEAFQSDVVTSAFKMLGQSLDFDGKSKLTVYNTILKTLGVDVTNKKRASIEDQVKNSNPFAAMERFTTTYGNHIKMDMFEKGVKKLQVEGKNPVEHKKDYERLAKAINTLTGRANLGRFDGISPELNALFFSVRFAASTFNKLNPAWYSVVLRDSENPTKPSVAQKMAISQVSTYIATTTAFILAIQALGGEDEDGEDIVKIETNPTSSDFGKLKIGDIRFDPWGGHLPWVTLFGRMASGKMKKSNGKVINLGEGNNDTKFDKIVDFGVGKLNPTLATGVRFLRANEEIDGTKRDKYGNEVSIEEELRMMYPIYWQGIKEVMEENPEKGKEIAYGLTALGFLGVNNQVYGSSPKDLFKSYSKDVKNELNTKRNQYIRPDKKQVTSDSELDAQFESFKQMHEQNYTELIDRVKKEMTQMNFVEVMQQLKAGGHSKDAIKNIMQGKYPEMIEIQKSTIDLKLQSIENKLSKKELENLEEIKKDVLKKYFHYNYNVKMYNNKLKYGFE